MPSLSFPDLSGKIVDLATLRGRRKLALLWDPACGLCLLVTEDVKSWERKHADNAPELLIISAGSAEVVRGLGFRSQVLLDQHFAAGTVLDEDGRVASEVGGGISGVFDFLGTVPYVPSSELVVDTMLRLADVGMSDTVFDLGCGDGRIVIAAAKTFGAHGVGVDIDPDRIREARANARKASVKSRVRFEQKDLLDVDIRNATVVTLYLIPTFPTALRPKLLSELQPGTRVVSQLFDIADWKPDKEEWTAERSPLGPSRRNRDHRSCRPTMSVRQACRNYADPQADLTLALHRGQRLRREMRRKSGSRARKT